MVAVVPVMVNGRLGLVSFLDDTSIQRDHVLRTMVMLVALSLLVSVLFLVLANLLGRRIIGEPVAGLTRVVSAVGRGRNSTCAPSRTAKTSWGALARAFNGMAAQLQATQARLEQETQARIEAIEGLRHADRLATVGKLAAGLAHELGTPLNTIGLQAQLIAGSEVSDEVRERARAVRQQGERMTHIVRQLLDFSRPRAAEPRLLDLLDVVRRGVAFLEPLARQAQVELQVEDGVSAPVSGMRCSSSRWSPT